MREAVYANSLILAMGVVFFACWFAQSATGWSEFNDRQASHHESPVSWFSYIVTPTSWEATFHNWQSEFLA